jgi:membrane associated rhomboid family serine protease
MIPLRDASREHVIGNMVFLAAFAPMVEDAMGRARRSEDA